MRQAIYRHAPARIKRHVVRLLGIPSTGNFTAILEDQRIRLTAPSSTSVLRDLYLGDLNSPNLEPETRNIFKALVSKPGAVFFDVGSHVGFYIYFVKAVNQNAQVYAFEPVPHNFSYIVETVQRNNLKDVTVENLAVSDRTGEATLFIPEDKSAHTCIASLKNRFEDSEGIFRDRKHQDVTVKTTSIDDYVNRQAISRLDLMKIDVEEAEMEVLRGASETLRRLKPDVVCEILINTQNKQKIFDFLLSSGYNAYLITNGGLVAESFPLTLPRFDSGARTQWKNHYFTMKTREEVRNLSVSCFGRMIDRGS